MLSRRHTLSAALLPVAACARAAPASEELPRFRQPGDVDDSAALARAFASGRPVHAPAGAGSGPQGKYLVTNDASGSLPSGAVLSGDGIGKTVFARSYRQDKPFLLHADSRSPDPRRNLSGLRFAKLSFEDEVAARGFSEYNYLVMLSGVTDVAFDQVGFRGFRGDGLHLGQSVVSRTERHNLNVTVRDCMFDGVNSNNRNAISVIDCAGLLVERSQFLNCSRPGNGSAAAGDPMRPATGPAMPGAIDLEPNGDAFTVLRDITIRRNLFRGGGGYAVALNLSDNDRVTAAQHGFVVEDNIVEDRAGGIAATCGAPDGSRRPYDIAVRRNQVRRCAKPFLISGVRGVELTANVFIDCGGAAELGYAGTVVDATLADNQFVRVGSKVVPYGLWIRATRNLVLGGNLFDDCGAPDGAKGIAVGFVAGTSRDLHVERNRFRATTGRMEQAVTVFRDARIDRASLRVAGNEISLAGSGMTASFGVPR